MFVNADAYLSPDLLGKNFILGLQGDGVSFLDEMHILATAKHFLGDGGTDNGIDQGDTIVNEITLKDIHGLPYYDAIDSCALSIMASFNSWNGLKRHGNRYLLMDILKSQMNFEGFIVCDWNGHGQIEGCEDSNCPDAFNVVDFVQIHQKKIGYATLFITISGKEQIRDLDEHIKNLQRKITEYETNKDSVYNKACAEYGYDQDFFIRQKLSY